jgi:lycopene beta-cyclase
MLESHHFYENALGLIGSNANIQLMLGQEVRLAPIKTEHGWYIKTGNLELTATQVLDTRPPKKVSHNDSVLWQSFVGYEVQTESDCFSPEQMVLMAFDHSFKSGLAFTYILPTTEKKALIEYTVFSENRMSEEELMEGLKKSIGQQIANRPYKILRVEHGILPMGNKLTTQNNESSYLFAGLFEGAARPSSGYAFQRIQSWANKCAHSMVTKNTLYAFPKEKRLQSFMDGLFLNVIKKNPTMAASLFEDLFRECNLKTVVKFMSDQASISDCLEIIRALPPKPFIEALPHFIIQKIYNHFRLI